MERLSYRKGQKTTVHPPGWSMCRRRGQVMESRGLVERQDEDQREDVGLFDCTVASPRHPRSRYLQENTLPVP